MWRSGVLDVHRATAGSYPEHMIRDRLASSRDRFTRRMLRIGLVRRWYARRLVKYMEKSRKKQRKLPDHLVRLDQMTRRLPQPRRVATVEELITPGADEHFGREFRRAAARQDRARGGRSGGRRPGMPPQAVVKRVQKGR